MASTPTPIHTAASTPANADGELRERALVQLRKKAQFRAHARVYVLVNAWHVVVWAAIFGLTGAGFFWPIFPALGWAIGLGFNAWDVYGRADRRQVPAEEDVPAEEEIGHEMDALRTQVGRRGVAR